MWLAHAAVSDHAVEAACTLVARCSDWSAERVLDAAVGTRVELLWEIRRATFGDVLDAVVECDVCGEKLDVDLTIPELVAGDTSTVDPSNADTSAGKTSTVDIDGRTVNFRLPTGRDQLAVAGGGERALCRRIVVDVDGQRGDALSDALVDALVDPLGDAVAAIDTAADTTIGATCPACGAGIAATLDAYGYLRDELLAGIEGLLIEVHVLASRYHWSETDILSLPLARRRAYLELIADEGARGVSVLAAPCGTAGAAVADASGVRGGCHRPVYAPVCRAPPSSATQPSDRWAVTPDLDVTGPGDPPKREPSDARSSDPATEPGRRRRHPSAGDAPHGPADAGSRDT